MLPKAPPVAAAANGSQRSRSPRREAPADIDALREAVMAGEGGLAREMIGAEDAVAAVAAVAAVQGAPAEEEAPEVVDGWIVLFGSTGFG